VDARAAPALADTSFKQRVDLDVCLSHDSNSRYPRTKAVTEAKVTRLLTISGNPSFIHYTNAKRMGRPVQEYFPIGTPHRDEKFSAQLKQMHRLGYLQRVRTLMKENLDRTLRVYRKVEQPKENKTGNAGACTTEVEPTQATVS